MKKIKKLRFYGVLAAVFFILSSCAAFAPAPAPDVMAADDPPQEAYEEYADAEDAEQVAEEVAEVAAEAVEPEIIEEEIILPEITAFVPPPEEPAAEIAALPQPEFTLPEVVVMEPPPQEEPVAAELPVPAAPPPPAVVAPPPPPVVAPPPPADPPPAVAAPPPPPVVAPPPPADPPPAVAAPPPPFMAPAQEPPPPAVAAPPAAVLPPSPAPAVPAPTVGSAPQAASPQGTEAGHSRTVTVPQGQLLEVPFRGTGWVFLGEQSSQNGIQFNYRRNEAEGMSFVFRADRSGIYTLMFFRQDFLRDIVINDFVQVIVEGNQIAGSPPGNSRVIAGPRWPSALEEAEMRRRAETGAGALALSAPPATPPPVQIAPPAQVQIAPPAPPPTQVQITPPPAPAQVQIAPPVQDAPPSVGILDQMPAPALPPPVAGDAHLIPIDSPPAFFMDRARDLFGQGDVAGAIATLERLREIHPQANSDEVYWLLGQFFEANSPSRNILAALDNYRRLVQGHPLSSRMGEARSRIAFLERFFININ